MLLNKTIDVIHLLNRLNPLICIFTIFHSIQNKKLWSLVQQSIVINQCRNSLNIFLKQPIPVEVSSFFF